VLDEEGRVEGFVAAKVLLGESPDRPLKRFVHPAYVLDPDDSLDEVIQGLRRHQQPIGLVRGSEGETLGVVTPEDVLEEVVGELHRMPGSEPRP
jgi:CBS domain containing-hemolysin-like protein